MAAATKEEAGRISARLPVDLIDELKELANREGCSLTEVIEMACRQLLAPTTPAAPAKPEPHRLIVRTGSHVYHYIDYAGASATSSSSR